MDLKELVGEFEFEIFEDLPSDLSYYVRGEGVLARLDRIKNGSTSLDSNVLQLFFQSQEARKKSLRMFSSRNEICITDIGKESIQLQTDNQEIRFFKPEIESAETLTKLAQLTIDSIVLKRKENGEAVIFSVEGAESDVENRKIRSCGDFMMKSTYRKIFNLVRAGFDVSDELLEKIS